MIRSILSVGGFTLLSRATGLARDILLGAVLGAGAATDAFVIAFRLPNHFRAIFGEGAFNAAYVPAYAGALEREGATSAHRFASRIFTLLLLSQIIVLALAWTFTPQLVEMLAPGFRDEPGKFELAVSLTRITFPYLLCITLVTLMTGTLNAHGRYAAGAFAPVLLNGAMIAGLSCAFLFPSAAYAASFGVLAAGVLQLIFLAAASWRAGTLERLTTPTFDDLVRRFFRALGPAVIGSAGVQIALFADTIIGSLLPTGGVSSLYYADRLYQLPIGVVGIAAGTVLLPTMSRAFAAGNADAAFRAQNRTMALSLLLCIPCFVAFLIIPDLLVRAAFLRGQFTTGNADASARVLAAYAAGLLPIVLIASARASFQARGDTTTPMMVALAAVACNVAIKLALFGPLGAAGLAVATAIGAWINVVGLLIIAWRTGSFCPDAILGKVAAAAVLAGVALTLLLFFGQTAAMRAFAGTGTMGDIAAVAVLGAVGLFVYGGVLLTALVTFGVDLSALRPMRRVRTKDGQ